MDALRPVLGAGCTVREVLDGFRDSHPATRRVLLDGASYVGQAAGMLCNAINPSAIVIGGCLAEAGQPYLDEVRRVLDLTTIPIARDVELRTSTLGSTASALGAVALTFAHGLKAA